MFRGALWSTVVLYNWRRRVPPSAGLSGSSLLLSATTPDSSVSVKGFTLSEKQDIGQRDAFTVVLPFFSRLLVTAERKIAAVSILSVSAFS